MPTTPDPSAGLPLDLAAKTILGVFLEKPPASGWVEVRLAPLPDGGWPTSYALEAELRHQAAAAFPSLDVGKVCAELVWLERGLPARMQAGCVYKR